MIKPVFILVIVCMLFTSCGQDMRNVKIDESQPLKAFDHTEYIKVDCSLLNTFAVSEGEKIESFIDWLNSLSIYKTVKRHTTNDSPDWIVALTKKDSSKEELYIYGAYIRLDDVQYKIVDYDKLYKELERFETIFKD